MEKITIDGYDEFRHMFVWYEELKDEGLTNSKAMNTVYKGYIDKTIE